MAIMGQLLELSIDGPNMSNGIVSLIDEEKIMTWGGIYPGHNDDTGVAGEGY